MNDLQTIYADLKTTARDIARRYPGPKLSPAFSKSLALSKNNFETDPFLKELRQFVKEQTRNNLGHGPGHARKVALDAGAIIATESTEAGYQQKKIDHLVFLAHCAGLLHDIRRSQKNHASRGAAAARQILNQNNGRPTPPDIENIALAINNHEAFKETSKTVSPVGTLISGSLYDADKFRWGTDNFTHTVWNMIETSPPPLRKFVRIYPRAMIHIASIKTTFRTLTGQHYGPQFIDTGLALGEELFKVVKSKYGHLL